MSTPQAKSACLSNLALDKIIAREPVAAAQEHLQGCDRCSDRLLDLQQQRATFQAKMPAFSTLQAISEHARPGVWQRWKAAGPRLALALSLPLAAAAALLIYLHSNGARAVETTRSKGAPTLEFYIKRGHVVMVGGPGEELRPDDAVRFSYTSESGSYLLILSIDSNSQISVYHADQDKAVPAVAAVDQELAGSIVLDEVLGSERVYGFFCQSSVAVRDASAALRANPLEPTVPGCSVAQLQWLKVAP